MPKMTGRARNGALLGAAVLASVGLAVTLWFGGAEGNSQPTPSAPPEPTVSTQEVSVPDEYDVDLEDPVVDGREPTTVEDFIEDSREGIAPGEEWDVIEEGGVTHYPDEVPPR